MILRRLGLEGNTAASSEGENSDNNFEALESGGVLNKETQ